jgi:hypothetical protein
VSRIRQNTHAWTHTYTHSQTHTPNAHTPYRLGLGFSFLCLYTHIHVHVCIHVYIISGFVLCKVVKTMPWLLQTTSTMQTNIILRQKCKDRYNPSSEGWASLHSMHKVTNNDRKCAPGTRTSAGCTSMLLPCKATSAHWQSCISA